MGEVLIAALRCQRDQAGYISDYVSKRQPIARDEIKAFMQGQHQLCAQLNMKNASTVRHAKRSAQRIMSDLYGRGTLRMAVEAANPNPNPNPNPNRKAVNLLTMRKNHDVTRAESFKSSLLVPFPCAQYLVCQRASYGYRIENEVRQPLEIDRRNGNKPRVVTDRNVGYKYGYRGTHAAVRYLSPYESNTQGC